MHPLHSLPSDYLKYCSDCTALYLVHAVEQSVAGLHSIGALYEQPQVLHVPLAAVLRVVGGVVLTAGGWEWVSELVSVMSK